MGEPGLLSGGGHSVEVLGELEDVHLVEVGHYAVHEGLAPPHVDAAELWSVLD